MSQLPTIKIDPSSPRAQRFMALFGKLSGIPVMSAQPTITTRDGQHIKAYVLDGVRLTGPERSRLINFYINRGMEAAAARDLVVNGAVPIEADGCEVEQS